MTGPRDTEVLKMIQARWEQAGEEIARYTDRLHAAIHRREWARPAGRRDRADRIKGLDFMFSNPGEWARQKAMMILNNMPWPRQ